MYKFQSIRLFAWIGGLTVIALSIFTGSFASSQNCEDLGWFPKDFGLKDHTVFRFAGFYYLASIYLPEENKFAYARTHDFCNWEDLSPILAERTSGDWDEKNIWAPFVLEDNGVFYMYYTGVTNDFTQSIMLATSSNPADPTSWQEYGMVFQPSHPDAIWTEFNWSDCRDPHVLFVNGVYYLYYTGTDTTGGIVGVASAYSPTGPWTDLGSVLEPVPDHSFESPTLFYREGFYYLIYHDTLSGISEGVFSVISPSPTGLWVEPVPLAPGWAHEFWQDSEDNWRISYLTSYVVNIDFVTWNPYTNPPRPLIGKEAFFSLLPVIVRE
jgi:hypothetical protein